MVSDILWRAAWILSLPVVLMFALFLGIRAAFKGTK
jgi:hypothetical protein